MVSQGGTIRMTTRNRLEHKRTRAILPPVGPSRCPKRIPPTAQLSPTPNRHTNNFIPASSMPRPPRSSPHSISPYNNAAPAMAGAIQPSISPAIARADQRPFSFAVGPISSSSWTSPMMRPPLVSVRNGALGTSGVVVRSANERPLAQREVTSTHRSPSSRTRTRWRENVRSRSERRHQRTLVRFTHTTSLIYTVAISWSCTTDRFCSLAR